MSSASSIAVRLGSAQALRNSDSESTTATGLDSDADAGIGNDANTSSSSRIPSSGRPRGVLPGRQRGSSTDAARLLRWLDIRLSWGSGPATGGGGQRLAPLPAPRRQAVVGAVSISSASILASVASRTAYSASSIAEYA